MSVDNNMDVQNIFVYIFFLTNETPHEQLQQVLLFRYKHKYFLHN